jgi:hypothetical protein
MSALLLRAQRADRGSGCRSDEFAGGMSGKSSKPLPMPGEVRLAVTRRFVPACMVGSLQHLFARGDPRSTFPLDHPLGALGETGGRYLTAARASTESGEAPFCRDQFVSTISRMGKRAAILKEARSPCSRRFRTTIVRDRARFVIIVIVLRTRCDRAAHAA